MLAVGLAAFGWFVHASYRTLAEQDIIAARDATIARLETRNDAQSDEVERLERTIAALQDERDRAILARNSLDKELTRRVRERDEALAAASRLQTIVENSEESRIATSDVAMTLENELATSYLKRWRVEESLQVAEDRIAALEEQGGLLRDRAASSDRQATVLKDRIATLELIQGELVARLAPVTNNQLARLEGHLGAIGIDIERLVSGDDAEVGGPFIALTDNERPTIVDARLTALATGIQRLDALRAALPVMPLAEPVDEVDISSRFGNRRDPINGRLAFHAGTDFRGPVGTPVHVTAPGEVIRAGWAGAYGRMVRVRHAFGIETTYAHLSRVSVKVGDKVEVGDTVGKLGNSGRSTGPHLHYEVRFDDVPRDPLRFIEAGRHVQEEREQQAAVEAKPEPAP
ncbi:peptidoglycan DD-metalloendopeptidase family protein [Zavarzinia compransoris]|uniref:M23 family metallopeptidase n=1 Tax=Zavarzinia marina TaxID=2911065 RepID=UPI001F357701|nr:M23 family metallopeptidase [Zavarzinia marina]MCF4164513.1 peptidoglycan DD-metalloendopeptidase family protein [Zavarzinia marina]